MRPFTTRAVRPTPAERMRSILAAAHSMTVVADGVADEVHRLDGAGVMGHVHLHDPGDPPGAGAAPHAPRIPVRLELTDIAPTPVRDRLRARVTLTGLLAAPYEARSPDSTCVEFGQAVVEDSEGRTFVTLDDLQAVDPDPIAPCEADMLTHLVDGHGELVPLLLRLVRPKPERGMVRAVPLAMDRYGLTLRLEHRRAHRDVRLPFPTPVTHIDQAGPQLHALIAAARRSSHSSGLPA
ncbi:DUF2470 domain-containing protein [uncultured Streptomyces sp.]|uniref:DUF2470 domain-containing protein n=1 Tax=uncultured Streptomyces sp. TaxID=174707 RepID=UPI0026057F23|nr:DUF2470 domain-containing protein [uncultured Streptomyces sp.]